MNYTVEGRNVVCRSSRKCRNNIAFFLLRCFTDRDQNQGKCKNVGVVEKVAPFWQLAILPCPLVAGNNPTVRACIPHT